MASDSETILSKIKIPLPDLLNAILALDASAMDNDQVENVIRICQSKEDMEMLKFFAKLMKVPRIEEKLGVFGFKIAYASKVEDLRSNLNTVIAATKEMMESAKLRQIMQIISTQENLGGSDAGSELYSLVKLSDNMALMNDLCKLVGEKMPELLDFGNDLVHLEAASKIELKTVIDNMRAFVNGLRDVEQEFIASENDGAICEGFRKAVYDFLGTSDAEAQLIHILYNEAGRTLDFYLAEYPARFSFEEVSKTLTHFMKTFIKSREEIERQAEAEKKILEKETMNIEQNKNL